MPCVESPVSSLRRTAERGLSLAELLVAVMVLGLATSIALVLYNGARRSFKVGDNLIEQQQVVRIAFDMLSRDLHLTGFNHNPDGHKTRPDEQIEAAYATAIAIRADFDATDPAAAEDPELDLADGGAFLTVSTGNDEIVAYALAKAGGSGPDQIEFDADVIPVPRDGEVERVTIDDVATEHDDPPYTLYRFTVSEGTNTVQGAPLIDNVRSLRFVYYDGAGNEVAPPGGLDDFQGDNRRSRASIRRIGLEIEGMTRDRDPRWVDPNDENPLTREYRKYRLSGDITPRNLGLFGLKDLDANLTPPSEPPPPALYPGHCKGLYVEWSPNPPQDEVARYEIRHGTDPDDLTGPDYAVEPEFYLQGLEDGVDYYVTIEAVDDSGNVSPRSDPSHAVTENLNTPARPESFSATLTPPEQGRVDLSWYEVTSNAGTPPVPPEADPLSPQLRDMAGYRLYRGPAPEFELMEVIAEPVDVTFSDTQLVNCRDYFYRVVAVDHCDRESSLSDAVHGKSYYDIDPEAPLNVQAYRHGSSVWLRWDPVTRDVEGNVVFIEDYRIWSTGFLPVGAPPDTFSLVGQGVPGVTEYTDPLFFIPGQTIYYRVTASDYCPNESAPSEEAEPTCDFSGNVTITQPPDNATVSTSTSVLVDVMGGTASYPQMTLTIEHLDTSNTVVEVLASAPPWTHPWPASASDPGAYRIDADVQQINGCTQRTSVFVERQ